MALGLAAGAAFCASTLAAEFATPGGPPPDNVAEVAALLREDPYDLELLISFGTSKGASAGHLALAIREEGASDETVYSANFYADRAKEHAKGFYTQALMSRIPRTEYLFATASTVAPTMQFGLDFGEVYKRAVIGVRVHGVPRTEREALASFFERINVDYHARRARTEYHDREVKYDYLRLNCAKTIAAGFHYGAGYSDLEVANTKVLPGRTRVIAALNANIPTEMAVKLIAQWDKRGYRMDTVLYKKYEGSPYVDPRDEERVMFRDLPNRFPSVLSRDFMREQGEYRDYDNLYAMYLLFNLGRHIVKVDPATRRLEIEASKAPMPYAEAARQAAASAKADSEGFGRGEARSNAHLYDFPVR
jgi:hypothetical protein